MTDSNVHNEEISLKEILDIIISRFYIIVVFLIISIGIALFYLNHAVNIYQTSIIMLIEPMKETSTIGKILSSDFFDSDNDISTEIKLITNVTNLNTTINTLDLSTYKNSKGLDYTNPGVVGSLVDKINIINYKDTNIVELSVKDENPQFAADFANALAFNFNLMLSEYGKESKTSQITFLDKQIPNIEEDLDNANDRLFNYKASTGIDFLSNNAASLVNHITYLDLRKKPLELQIDKSNSELLEYQKKYNYVLPTYEAYKYDTQIKEILKNYEMAFDELILYDMVSNNDYRNTTSLSVVNLNLNASINDRIVDLNFQMAEAKKALRDRIKSFTEENVNNLNLKNINDLNKYYFTIVDKLCSEVDIINIQKNIEEFEIEFNKLPVIQKELSMLESDVESIEEIRKELNSLHEQLSLTSAAQNNNVKLVSPALVPTIPVSPNKLLILAVSALLGLVIGFVLCIIIYLRDDKIHSLDDLKIVSGSDIPILGWTPLVVSKNNNKQIIYDLLKDSPNSYIANRYKSITSNIIYGDNSHNKIFTITSSNVNEGKSSLICNISLCLSLLGFKVLIIDGDLKSPSIGKFFDIKSTNNGYIRAIQDNKKLDSIFINPIKDNKNIQLLLPGNSSLNPSVFYTHTDYKTSLEILRDKFDYIFIDSPPLEYASELLGLYKYIDSIILCTRMSIITKSNLKQLIEQLNYQKDKIGGIIATGCPTSKITSYSGYHEYSNYNYLEKFHNNVDYSIIKSERKAVRLFKKDIKERKKKDIG